MEAVARGPIMDCSKLRHRSSRSAGSVPRGHVGARPVFEMMLLTWSLLCVVVAIAAHMRGRNAVAWSLLALAISPLIASALLIALPSAKVGSLSSL